MSDLKVESAHLTAAAGVFHGLLTQIDSALQAFSGPSALPDDAFGYKGEDALHTYGKGRSATLQALGQIRTSYDQLSSGFSTAATVIEETEAKLTEAATAKDGG